MATLASFVSAEEYLRNPEWERCEYVDGAIEERECQRTIIRHGWTRFATGSIIMPKSGTFG